MEEKKIPICESAKNIKQNKLEKVLLENNDILILLGDSIVNSFTYREKGYKVD